MPFMFGPAPIRRTYEYLNACKLILRDRVRVMEVHYNMYWRFYRQDPKQTLKPRYDAHIGLREFYFWTIPQIQYKNPNLQIIRFLEMTPTPFIRCWFENGEDVLFDCDSKSKEQILSQLIKTIGKTKAMLELEEKLDITKQSVANPAIFGFERPRFCMCEIIGQVPCPGVVQLPKNLRGKYNFVLRDQLEKEEQDMVESRKDFEDYTPPKLAFKTQMGG